ncbi:guanylate cyclase domain-containing protein [Haematococcus lacustris]|uniref:Guanylate cyclase domain-containing protein n=1 Tax=Haematococcus lacustris TaxID=44745 RepID=A0A699ZHA6_HAELA|nr:guanylate cyclase domain-containing protein [Haematococcus lacustris]
MSARQAGLRPPPPLFRAEGAFGSMAEITMALDRMSTAGQAADRTPAECITSLHEGSPSCELRFLKQRSIEARTGSARWLWVKELVVDDLGVYSFNLRAACVPFSFKGVADRHRIVSVSSQRLSGRHFKTGLKKSKGEQVEQGQGRVLKAVAPLCPTPTCL